MQISFERPEYLVWLLAIPLLILGHYLFLRYTKHKALRFANFRALKRITGHNLITRNYLQLTLRILIVATAVLAASGAVLWYDGESSENDFVIAVDVSSSMSAQDIPPSRLEAAKEDAKLFVEALDAEARIGVISFAGTALIETVPIEEKEKVKDFIDGLELLPAGGTDIPGAIITATNLLLDNSRGRAIVLITDGSSTVETFLGSSIQRAVAYAQEHHVKVFTIGIGTNAGPIGYLPEYYNVSATFNEENLILIANATGATYTQAESDADLFAAFQSIASERSAQLLRRDLQPLLLLGALVLILIDWLLVSSRYRIIP